MYTKILFVFLTALLCYSCNSGNSEQQKKETDSLKNKLTQLTNDMTEIKNSRVGTPIPELYKQVKKGVFIVYCNGNNEISQGTGFFLNSSGVAISNYHVFENANLAVCVLDDGRQCLISKIIAYDKNMDYVIFKVDNRDQACSPLHMASTLPEIGSECFTVGNPKGLTQTLSMGIISGYREDNKMIQTTTAITHGSSGGPLFNKNGDVVGITSSGYGDGDLNFALNITRVPYPDYINDPAAAKNVEVPAEQIKNMLQAYYTALDNKDYEKLPEFYEPTLDRYYDEFNVTAQEAVQRSQDYWTKYKVLSAKNDVHLETIKIFPLLDGTFYAAYNMDYIIERVEKTKSKTFNLNIIMAITPDLKIRCIYENILARQ